MSAAARHLRRGHRVTRTLPIVVVGLTISIAAASVNASQSRTEAEALFDNEAEQAVALVEAEIDRHLEGVDDLRSFLSLSWPVSADDIAGYNQQVWSDGRFRAFNAPGIIASVPSGAGDEFVEWRRANDDAGFKIWTLGPVPDGDKLVLVGVPAPMGARSPEGLELSGIVGSLDIDLPSLRDGVTFAHNENVSTMLTQLTGMITDGGSLEESGIVGTDALLYAAIPGDSSDDIVAYAIVPTRLGQLLHDAVNASSQSLDITLSVAGRADLGEVGRFVTANDGAAAEHHELTRTIEAAGLDWMVTVNATEDFGRPSTLLTPQVIILVGAIMSLLLASIEALRRAKKVQLSAARFEIDVARTLAETDSLTGLLNRGGLAAMLQRHQVGQAAILFVDLDGFKSVNDKLGHEAGDNMLRETARNMRSALREGDLLARLGGDEFIAVLTDLTDREAVAEIAERVRSSTRCVVEDLAVSASVGVAIHDDKFPPVLEELLHAADLAMYGAKRTGGDAVLFEIS